jgi:diacylglycerol kinase (ATP)
LETKKALFIINPKAGGKNKSDFPQLVDKTIDKSKISATCVFTNAPFHATEIAKNAISEGYQYVFAVGGDGTMNEVAQSLLYTDIIFGIIPYGSGNGLGRHLGIPMDRKKAIELVNIGNHTTIDAGKLNKHYFFNVAGLSIDAEIAYLFANTKTRGFKNYVKLTLQKLFNYKAQNYTIKFDGAEINTKGFIVSIANSSQYGNNAHIAPKAQLNDGMLDIAIIKGFNLFNLPILVIRMFLKSLDKSTSYQCYQVKNAVIQRENDGPVHVDGEPIHESASIQIESLPASLKILIP